MPDITMLVVALKTLTLVLGGLITYFAVQAYRRTGAPALRALAIGFGIVTFGALLAGVIDYPLALGTSYTLIVDSALTTIGFAVIFYSVYR